MKNCPVCHHEVPKDATACPVCDAPIEMGIVPIGRDGTAAFDHANHLEPSVDLTVPKNITRWRGKPIVQGTIRLTGETQKSDKNRGFVDGFIKGMDALIGTTSRSSMTHLHFRIEDPEGNIIAAIIDGEYNGPPLEQGDFVSLWGYKRNNVVYISLFYNHNLKTGFKVK